MDPPKPVSATEIGCNSTNLKQTEKTSLMVALIVTTIFCSVLAIWLNFDKHVPNCDEANHVMNGLAFTDLIQHARPLRAQWWHQVFTINTYYPPVGLMTVGAACALIKNQILALQIVKIFWLALLSLSVGTITYKISRSSLAVAIAIGLVNTCNIVCDLSHTALLDLPVISMIAAGLAALYWKNGSAKPLCSLLSGLILGLAIMTKQVAIAFLGFPILLDLVTTLRNNRNRNGVKSVLLMLLPIIIICSPWTLLNYRSVQALNHEIAADLSKRGSEFSRIFFNAKYYLGSWFYCANLGVLLATICGFATLSKSQHKKAFAVWAAIIPAIGALTIISCQPARDRYSAPIVILMAVIGAVGLDNLFKQRKKLFAIVALCLLPLILALYFSFNFCPYPISDITLANLTTTTGGVLREHVSPFFDKSGVVYSAHSAPIEDNSDLATKILTCIAEQDGPLSSWLNITVSSTELDVHEMELMAKLRGLGVKPTTSRTWTALGDKEEFSQAKALSYRWYVLKDGNQGFRFADKDNLNAHEKLVAYIKNHYLLVKKLPARNGDDVFIFCRP